jgi:hypothetical protein
LFDETDALFEKRGEVRDGHDQYANMKVNYLLNGDMLARLNVPRRSGLGSSATRSSAD